MSHPGTEKIELTGIPLFRGVEDAVYGNLGDWVFYFRDGQKIFAQGEPADSMIVILRGEIQVLDTEKSELVLHPAVPIKGVGDVRLYSVGNQEATAAPQKEGGHDELELQHKS
jgi:hypothetical protein